MKKLKMLILDDEKNLIAKVNGSLDELENTFKQIRIKYK